MDNTLPTYNPPPLTKWQRECFEQGYFDFVIPRGEWFVTSQAALFLCMSVDSVLNLAEAGRLETQQKAITGKRKELSISRRSILLYHAANAQLDPRDLAKRAVDFIRAIKCPHVLTPIVAVAQAELKRLTDR